jgi:hypothetical protein
MSLSNVSGRVRVIRVDAGKRARTSKENSSLSVPLLSRREG